MFKKITRSFSFILLLAIGFTACTATKEKTPSSIDDSKKTYPEMISDKTELKLDEAKPIQARDIFNPSISMLKWSDPDAYSKGFQYNTGEQVTLDFSVDTGSILKPLDKFTTYFYLAADGSYLYSYQRVVVKVVGGSEKTPALRTIFPNINVGDKIIRIAVFPNKTYLVLPPIEIIA